MREIKFRAWIPSHLRMVEVCDLDMKGESISFIDYDGFYIVKWLSDVKLMQYTGVKDKNGKEIYEGDILLSTTEDGVFLVSIGFGYSEKDNDILGAFKLKIEKQLSLSQYFEDFDDKLIKLVNKYNIPIEEENNIKCINDGWQIIGNIYKNPELIGDDE